MAKVIAVRRAKRSLQQKGFREEKDDRDHDFFSLYDDQGQRTGIFTFFSRGSKAREIGPSLLNHIKRQLKLESLREAANLLECPMRRDEYLQKLRVGGHL